MLEFTKNIYFLLSIQLFHSNYLDVLFSIHLPCFRLYPSCFQSCLYCYKLIPGDPEVHYLSVLLLAYLIFPSLVDLSQFILSFLKCLNDQFVSDILRHLLIISLFIRSAIPFVHSLLSKFIVQVIQFFISSLRFRTVFVDLRFLLFPF